MKKHSKKAQTLLIVLIVMLVITIIGSTTVAMVSRYSHSIEGRLETLREEVYKD